MQLQKAISIIGGFAFLFLLYHLTEINGLNPFVLLMLFVLFLVITHFTMRVLRVGGLSAIGLQKHRGAGRNLLIGYVCGLLFYLACMIYAYSQGEIHFQGKFSFATILPIVLGMILLTLLSSASEDLLTRGFVFRFLPATISNNQAIVISSIVYVLNHIWRIGDGSTQWLLLFFLGLTFAIPFARTGSLWFTIGCHWGWNTFAMFKDHIGDVSSFHVIDQTSDWLYIVGAGCFTVFVMWFSRYMAVSPDAVRGIE